MCSFKLKQDLKEMPLWQVVPGCVPKPSALRHTGGTFAKHCPASLPPVASPWLTGSSANSSESIRGSAGCGPGPLGAAPDTCSYSRSAPVLNRQSLSARWVPGRGSYRTEHAPVHGPQSTVRVLSCLTFPAWTTPLPLSRSLLKYGSFPERHESLLSVSHRTQETLPLPFSYCLVPMYMLVVFSHWTLSSPGGAFFLSFFVVIQRLSPNRPSMSVSWTN